MINVVLPNLGEEVTEVTVSYWHFEEGDKLREGEDLVEIATDKATFNVPAPCSGILLEVFFEEGEVVHPGDVLATIDEEASVEEQ